MYKYYRRYKQIVLEKKTLEQILKYEKRKLDILTYGHNKEIKAINYEVRVSSSNGEQNINDFFIEYINQLKTVNGLEKELEEINSIIAQIEKDFKDYAQNFNDVEMKVFISYFIDKKPLNQILIPKSNNEWYSYKQILRIHKKICEKLKNK